MVVLGAFTAGRIHRFTTARLLARYGLLAAMVMILLLMLLKQNTLVLFRYSASMGLYYRDRWLLLAVASAVLCSLFPKKLMFVLMPLTALMAVQKPLFWFLSDFFYRNHFVNTEMFFVLLFYIALMFLAGMGLGTLCRPADSSSCWGGALSGKRSGGLPAGSGPARRAALSLQSELA